MKLPRKTWDLYLTNISATHLNPIQKEDAIRQVIIAEIQYQLRLSDHGLEEGRKINRLIRKHVKKILHLPTWVSNNWIHQRNGGNIPDLVTATMITRHKTTAKMKTSEDTASRHTGDQIHPMNEERLLRLRLLNKDNKKEHFYKTLEEQLQKTNNGKSLVTAIQSRHKKQWLWSKRGLTPGNKVHYIQALSGCLPTKVHKTRGIPDRRANMCLRCKSNEIEDNMHILSCYSYNKDIITKRHDHLVKKILKELVRMHPQERVWRERSWRSGTKLQRPDIMMVECDRVTIIEFTFPYETSEEYLESRRLEKVQKYQRLVEEELQQV